MTNLQLVARKVCRKTDVTLKFIITAADSYMPLVSAISCIYFQRFFHFPNILSSFAKMSNLLFFRISQGHVGLNAANNNWQTSGAKPCQAGMIIPAQAGASSHSPDHIQGESPDALKTYIRAGTVGREELTTVA
ncbi:hypothetical protein QU487_23645 [Crenobacter sp. SG2305]|uniref:hypothetical protein n=1 Tax=Crenobacter oryzisoli TaxID=3056844 RepID=UPI0025AA6148|nr:hypothetical protein [Crenobacter sp. SG2305]MDN0085686.1 hypothetical protein [Crenobacter sp. SG2305]